MIDLDAATRADRDNDEERDERARRSYLARNVGHGSHCQCSTCDPDNARELQIEIRYERLGY